MWTPDPAEQDADTEDDTDAPSEREARARARALRSRGECAGAFERRNIHIPDDVPVAYRPGLPTHLYEWSSVQIDADEETSHVA